MTPAQFATWGFFMATTKETLLKRISSHVNGVSELPEGDILDQWSDFLDESQDEAVDAIDFQSMIRVHTATVQQSGTSVALPDDFKGRFAGYVSVDGGVVQEVDPVEATFFNGEYLTWGGNQADGYYLKLNEATHTDISLSIPYHARATSLATLTAVTPLPIPEFLVARTVEKVMLQRGQTEYVEFQAKADLLLQRMAANEVSSDLQRNKTIRTSLEYAGFTLGDD